jgi:TolB-like protein
MSFFAELKRRKVFKVGAAYLIAAWVAIQAAAIIAPQLKLPEWVPTLVTVLVGVGFPIALVLAWFFDITPQGIKRDPADATPAADAAHMTTAAASTDAATTTIPRKSIAVLPFADLSPTRDQEYFSDGIAEEILNALVKLKDLKVAGRTSSFSFKGKNEDLRDIGRTLSVAHVLEGSVRKHGDRVRITAQLIQVDDGYHLWSESYDGELADVFELQERIARAIVHELDVILHGDARQRLVPVATRDPEAYALYLQASGIFNRREGPRFPEAIGYLQQALRLDSQYARACAVGIDPRARTDLRAGTRRHGTGSGASRRRARQHTRSASGRTACGDRAQRHAGSSVCRELAGDRTRARARFRRRDHRILGRFDLHQQRLLGARLRPARPCARDRSAVPECPAVAGPAIPVCGGYGSRRDPVATLGASRPAARQFRPAPDFRRARPGRRGGRSVDQRPERARFRPARRLVRDDGAGRVWRAQAHAHALDAIERYVAAGSRWLSASVIYALLQMGEWARALVLVREYRPTNSAQFFNFLWSPSMRTMRVSAEFRGFTRAVGLTDLWDRYGPPDGCRRNASGEYVFD